LHAGVRGRDRRSAQGLQERGALRDGHLRERLRVAIDLGHRGVALLDLLDQPISPWSAPPRRCRDVAAAVPRLVLVGVGIDVLRGRPVGEPALAHARLDEAFLGCPQQLILVRRAVELRQMGEVSASRGAAARASAASGERPRRMASDSQDQLVCRRA
jgi:hypothetical protein